MELSLSALQGLQVASTLPEEAYYRILNHAVRASLEVENVKDIGAGTYVFMYYDVVLSLARR